MLETIILFLIAVLSFFAGYKVNNKKCFKTEQRCLEISRSARDQDYKIKARDRLISNQTDKIIMKNEYLKEMVLAAENNTYSNDAVAIRKMKELAQTAIEI